MIAKISPKRGRRPVGLMAYLFGPGRANEHQDPHIVAADQSLGVSDGWRYNEWSEVLDIGRELDGPRRLFGTEYPGGHMWHCSISLPPEDSTDPATGERKLSDAQWGQVTREMVDRLGFTESSGHAPCRWVAVRHGLSTQGNDHIHLVASLIRDDGTKASIFKDRWKAGQVCAEFEKKFGLRTVHGRSGAGMPEVTRAEQEIADRAERAEPPRRQLARTVRGVATAAGSEAEFVRRLRRSELIVRPRFAPGGRDAVVGYSVALRPNEGEKPRWFGGGKLAPDLTLPRLREHWAHSPESLRQAAAEWRAVSDGHAARSGREATEYGAHTWERAAEAIADVREQLSAVPRDDHAAWSGAAREAAGIFAAWSARLEGDRPGPLARAADVLAQSAQSRRDQPHAARRNATMDLRGVAMVALQASQAGRGAVGQILMLRQLTRLMEALHDLHLAHGHADRAAELAAVARDELARLHQSMPGTTLGPHSGIPPARQPQKPGPDIGR